MSVATGARPTVLLGPQRGRRTVAEAVRDLGVDGPVGVVTAGWEERESEDTELAEYLGRPTRNLGLFPRCEQVFAADPELKGAMFARHDRMVALRELYRLRLAPALEALHELLSRTDPAAPDALVGPAIDAAVDSLRALDAHHLARVVDEDDAVFVGLAPREREAVARQREELRGELAGCGALLVAGGHVGILLNRLRLFDVLDLVPEDLPLVAWSGGAMVLTDRLVVFHDRPPHGFGSAEVHARGLGVAPGVVALPHAERRLTLDDPARVALLARRFAPDRVLALDAGARLDREDDGWAASGGARELLASGEARAEEGDG